MSWFEVDKGGLRQLLAGKDKTFIIRELIQNCWDEPGVTEVKVFIDPVENSPFVSIEVYDDAPEGFHDIKHAYTLFADTRKRPDPTKRGRFNLGEKQVLSICRDASIKTTTGTVVFSENGKRTQTREKTDRGSIFSAKLRMTRKEMNDCVKAAMMFIPPENIATHVNGVRLMNLTPEGTTEATLTTEKSNGDGVMTRTQRKTTIEIYKPIGDDKSMLYEMGLPVVELESGEPWHINVDQRVPLNSDRDNVSPAYLRDVRAEVLNKFAHMLDDDQASDAWVSDATEDERIEPEAVDQIMTKRFGEKRVVADPSDPQSKERAIMEGYTIVPSRALSKATWTNVRESGAIKSSSSIFGTVTGDGETIPRDEWTEDMATVAEIARRIANQTTGVNLSVTIYKMPNGNAADYLRAIHELGLNYSKLGKRWFKPENLDGQIELIVHELGHKGGGHLESGYIRTLCKIASDLFKMDRRALLADINNRA